MTTVVLANGFLAALMVAFVLGLSSDPQKHPLKDPKFYVVLVLGAVLGIGLLVSTSGCSSTPTLKPNSTPTERCVEVVTALCDRVAGCGFGSRHQCMAEQVPACVGMIRLPLAESQTCVNAVQAMPCDGTLPVECFAIGEYEER